MGVRFFISYTGADVAWAEWLAWQVETAGHQAVIQAWDFRPGENFVVQMRRGLDSADRTLAVVSASYLESVYGSDEWTAAFVHDRPEATTLLVVRVEDVPLPRLLRPWIYVDLVGLDAETATKRLLEGVQHGRRKPDRPPTYPPTIVDQDRPSFPGRGPTIWNLPPRNPVFTGRDEQLAQLHEQLASTTDGSGPVALVAQALYGLGGVGKTQIALEYAHRYAADYELAWWIPSETQLSVRAALARLAPKLRIAPFPDQEELVASVVDALRGRGRWLLVFDNAEEPADLIPYQPGGSGHMLVTSRNPAWATLGQPVRVDVLPRDQAVALLLRRIPDHDPSAADALAQMLGDLPLALEQAAAYLEQTGTPLSAYLSAYHRRHRQLLAKGRAVAYGGEVDTTWQLSIDRIATSSPGGIELLHLCSILAPDAIPLDLFTAAPEQLPMALATAVGQEGEVGIHEAVGACYRYSLVERERSGIRMHRLVQQVVRTQLMEADHHAAITSAIELLSAAFPSRIELEDPQRWPRCAQLLPHLLAATECAQAAGIARGSAANLLERAGRYLTMRGEYSAAKGVVERALLLAEAAHGQDSLELVPILIAIGGLLYFLRDLAGARAALERGVAISEAALDSNHLEVGTVLYHLGLVLREQGDLIGARAVMERSLAIAEATLGPNDPGIGVRLNQLGTVLFQQRDLVGARAILERALAIAQTTQGPAHPDVAGALNSLGVVLREQGDPTRACAAHERAVAISEAALGSDHPETAVQLHNLGLALREKGDLVGARDALRRSLAISEATLGREHPHTQTLVARLAGL
jgi:tetratricopeptide (TPR) repeat protein